jgi:hypothetical protein
MNMKSCAYHQHYCWFSKRWKLQQKCLIYCLCVSHTSTDYVSRFVNRCSINGLGKKYMFLFSFLQHINCSSFCNMECACSWQNGFETLSEMLSHKLFTFTSNSSVGDMHRISYSWLISLLTFLTVLNTFISNLQPHNYYSLLQKYYCLS